MRVRLSPLARMFRIPKKDQEKVISQLRGMVKQGLLTSYTISDDPDDPFCCVVTLEGQIYSPKQEVFYITLF